MKRHPVVAWIALEGLSARGLAHEIGLDENYVRLMLTGKRRASAPFRRMCAIRYGMPAEVLFLEDPNKDRPPR